MRMIARMPDTRQVGFLVDTLRNGGFDRKDMVISDLADAEDRRRDDPEEMADELAFIKTERDGLWEAGAFTDGIKGLNPGKKGIVVAVEIPRREAGRVRAMMEQSGAVEIIQD
ncbi:MAG: hypothetical protein K6T29_02285 [Peptococcaceae bacterium]|nr:hypothetical protein [Peptococcaceae bacterium]